MKDIDEQFAEWLSSDEAKAIRAFVGKFDGPQKECVFICMRTSFIAGRSSAHELALEIMKRARAANELRNNTEGI